MRCKVLIVVCVVLYTLSSALGQSTNISLVYPKDGQSVSDTSIILTWNVHANASTYHLQVNADSLFTLPMTVNDSLGTSNIDTVIINSGFVYYWRVRADTGAGNTAWSDVWSFMLFKPSDIANLKLWVRADKDITYDGSSKVSKWNDVSIDTNHYTQLTAGNQPSFVDSAINNLPVVRFDGADDYLESQSNVDLTSGSSLFMLARIVVRKNYNGLYRIAPSVSGGCALEVNWEMGSSGSGTMQWFANRNCGNTGNFKSSNAPPDVGNYFIEEFIVDTTYGAGYINGIQQTPTTYVNTNFSPSIAAKGFIGTAYQSGAYLNGDIAEIIIYNESLTEVDRLMVERYLRDKYAPPVNLGADKVIPYGFCDTTLDGGSMYSSYQWSTGNPADTSQTLIVNKSGLYSVTVTDIFGYTSSDSINVYYSGNITPFPDTTICQGDTVVWSTGLDTLGYDFLWSDASTDSSLSIAAQGSYYVTMIDTIGAGCSLSSDTFNIAIDSFASIMTLGNDTAFCAGNSVGLIQGDSLAVSYLWSTGDTTASIVIFLDTTVELTAISANSCVVADSISVTINGTSPVAGFTSTSFCFGDPVQFTDTSSAPMGDTLVSWQWDFGDSNNDSTQNPTHVYADSGTYTVGLTVTANTGCSQFFSSQIYIAYYPEANFVNSVPVLVGSSVIFSDSSNAYGQTLSWQWDFGDSGVDTVQNPTHIYSGVGSYLVTLIVNNSIGCSDTSTQIVNVIEPPPSTGMMLWLRPEIGVTYNVSNEVAVWVDQSLDSNDFTQGITASKPIFIDSTINNYPVLDFDGTADYLQSTKAMDLGGGLSYFVVAKNKVRKNFNGLFRNASTVATGSTLEITWEIGSTSMGSGNISYVVDRDFAPLANTSFINAPPVENSYYILDIVASALGVRVDINGANVILESDSGFVPQGGPLAGFLGTGYQSGSFLNGEIAEVIIYSTALGDSSRLNVVQYLRDKYAPPVDLGPDRTINKYCPTVLDANKRYVDYQWSTLPSDINQTLSVNQTGTYSVTVTDIFGFTSSDTININYLVSINQFPDATICMGDSAIWDSQVDTSIYSMLWQDGSVGSTFTISQAGTYYFSVTDDLGCVVGSNLATVVIDSFEVIMMIDPTDTVCAGNPVSLIAGAASASTYLWDNGATTSSRLVDVSGIYSVTVTDTNGCVATDSVNKYVKGVAPSAGFSYTATCFGDSTTFADLTDTSSSGAIVSWSWDFGDGNSDTIASPVYLYDSAGTYIVNFMVVTAGGCAGLATQTIQVHGLPSPDFGPLQGCSRIVTTMQDLSTIMSDTIVSWLWLFDSLGTDSIANAPFVYPGTGDYGVTLIATSNYGCVDTITQTVTVKETPDIGFDYLLSCGTNSVTFYDTSVINSPGTPWYTWSFGDNSSSTTPYQVTHTYISSNVYNVTLTIQLANGCSTTLSDSINVAPIAVDADFGGDYICVNQPHTFLDISTAMEDSLIIWYWQMSPFGNTSEQNPIVTYIDSGTYTVSLAVTSAEGCMDSITKTVTVHGRPSVDFNFSPQFGVNQAEPVKFTNLSVSCESYRWDFGDGTDTVTSDNPTHQYVDTGIYQVTLHCLSEYNCQDSLTRTIDVRQATVDVEVAGLTVDCLPDIVENVTVTLVNRGTREITSLDLFMRVDGREAIREQWTGFIPPSGVEIYTFSVAYPLTSSEVINYLCVWTEKPNGVADEVPTNNEKCVACDNNFSIVDLFPNPATDVINAWFILPQAEHIEAALYDERGAYIGSAFSGTGVKGLNQVEINTSGLGHGIYALRIEYLGNSHVRTFVVH